jgi:tripartite-type tricarboxylate transporter receptor subunit TctC
MPAEAAVKIPRRAFLYIAAGAAAAKAVPCLAGPPYPSRPVRLIVGFPPGGSADVVARLIAEQLSERLGHPVVVENRPGASGNIGTEAVARADADGHTLLFATSTNSINAALYQNLAFDFSADIAAVAGISRNPFAMAVNPSVPARGVAELVAYAKANPGKLTMASAGNGTPHHLFGELFKIMTGITMLHVPYRGEAPALVDLMAGQMQVMFTTVGGCVEYIRDGKLRPLAVTTPARLDLLPDVPAVAEFVPGYEASGWFGLGAPRGTPVAIVEQLNREIGASLADPALSKRLVDMALTPMPMTPADFGKFIVVDMAKWTKVVRVAAIKLQQG